MKHGRKGYVKSSAFYDVSLNKSDTYVSVIRKICDAIGEDCCDEMRLFNGKGAVIPDQCLDIREKKVDWTIGSFLLKRHSSPDKVSFGIGIVDEDEPRPKKAKGNNRLKWLYF